MNAVARAVIEDDAPAGGAQLLRMALHESIRRGRAAGELPLHQEHTMSPPGDLPEVRLAAETIEVLREEMRHAAREAVDAMLTPERAKVVFEVFFTVLREQLASGAGTWMLGGVWSVVKVGFWGLLALVALLILGGPGLVKALAATFWAHITKS